jgi:hypothetical protein
MAVSSSVAPDGFPASDEYAPFYAGYVARVGDPDPLAALQEQLPRCLGLLRGLSPELQSHRYEPGKWSVKEVVGHMADAERVFGYRALRFARGDRTPLPAFEQNTYVEEGGFDARPWKGLVAELEHLRRANIELFAGLDTAAWGRDGVASDFRVTVRALAFILAGHVEHHLVILQERYGLAPAK